MATQFRFKLVEMDELQREIVVRSRDSSRLQELRRALVRNRENLNTVSEINYYLKIREFIQLKINSYNTKEIFFIESEYLCIFYN